MQNAETAIGAKNQEEDGTIIVPNAELQSIIVANKVAETDANRLQKEFSGVFAVIEEWEGKNASLVIERADQVDEMTLASDGAKKVAKARIAFTKAWKDVKQPYLQATQALDAINRFALAKFKPLEDALESKAATGARLAQAERELVIANRKAALLEVGHNGEIPGLGEMSEVTFQTILAGAKFQAQQAKENAEYEAAELAAAELAAKQETERLANLEKTINARVLKLVEIGAKRNIDPNEYLFLGDVLIYVESLGVLQDESFDLLVGEFQTEADRLKQIEAERLALLQRTQDRKLQLVQMPNIELNSDTYVLGNASVAMNSVILSDDAEWNTVIAAFTSERDRLAQEAAAKEKQAQDRLQTANDRLAQLRNVEFNALFVDVADLTDVEFDALLKVRTNEFNSAKERQRIANLGLMRKPLLDAQGEIRNADFLGGLTNDEFQAMLDNATRLKANADQQRANEAAQAAIEAQRKADEAKRIKDEENARKKAESATDKEKLEEMVNQIQAIVMPTCSSIQGDAIARGAIERLNKIVGHMHEAMNNM